MRCPFCDAEKESLQVIDSRTCENGRAVRRRRKCLKCAKRFTTYERIEAPKRLAVVKRDGRRVPWDKEKVLAGLERACFKRPVPERELQRIADEVEEEAFAVPDREIQTTLIGEWVTDRLRRLDQVAYVRFASVHRQFKTLEDLVEDARSVLDALRYDDPGQGRLFLEPPKPGGQNGRHAEDSTGEAPANSPTRRRKKRAPEPTPETGTPPQSMAQ